MKKVLVYRSDLLPYSETFIREQVVALSRWTAVLVGRRSVNNGVSLSGLNYELLDDAVNGFFGKFVKGFRYLFKISSAVDIERLRGHEFSLVHAHFGTEAIDAWPIARDLGVRLVVTLHGYDVTIKKWWWRLGNGGAKMIFYPSLLLGLAKKENVEFVAVSEAIKKKAIEFGIPEEKITVSYIGCDLNKFDLSGAPIDRRRKKILFVGRLVEKKGCRYLIEAFSRLKARVPDAELVVVGDGPEKKNLVELASFLNAPVIFMGALTSAEVKKQLDEARVFCLPSVASSNGDSEGFGLVLLEAQACGVPVVTSALGGAQEGVLNGVTGFSVKERDVDGIETGLYEILSSDVLLQNMSYQSRQFVEKNFSITHCVKKLEDIYDALS